MPRLVHAPPKLRFHKASGQFVVTTPEGDTYLGKSKAKARLAYRRIVADWNREAEAEALAAAPLETTIAELCIDYWHHAVDDYGEGSGSLERIRQAMRWLRKAGEDLPLAHFRAARLKAIQAMMVAAGLGRRYINYLVDTIRRAVRWAVVAGKAAGSLAHELDCVESLRKGRTKAKDRAKIGPVDDATFLATLPELTPVVVDLLRIVRLTGMRPGEGCQLRPADIDRTGDIWMFRPARHKNEWRGQERIVAIGPQAQAVLAPYLQRDADAFCFSPREAVDVFHAKRAAERKTPKGQGNGPGRQSRPKQQPGDHYTTGALSVAVGRAIKRINKKRAEHNAEHPADPMPMLTSWRPNQLRHAAATAIRREHGVEAAQVVLGHAHVTMTENYAEKNAKLAAAVAAKVG